MKLVDIYISLKCKYRIASKTSPKSVLTFPLAFVGNNKYLPEILHRAFEYFAKSRSLYSCIRDDYKTPSILTLGKLTSKVAT